MPVIFACLSSGNCTVVYDDPKLSQAECEKRVVAIVQHLQKQQMTPVVASCLKSSLVVV